jgi:flagellar M-ring protein FliF
VHLAIPEKSLFKESEKVPTASVVLRMKANRSLRESEVQGIVHLVSSSIEGMDTEHVTVLDSRGKVLSKGGPTDPSGRMSSAMQEVQRGYERNLEERLQSLPDKVVGSGRSAARVTATFNFKQVEKFEERYDPETTAVRSEQRSEEKAGSTTVAAGVPGVQTNLGRTAPAPSTAGGSGSKSDETLNYEVSRSTARTIEPVGTVEKVSVAVLVDGKYETPAAVKEGGSAKAKYLPRTPEELQKIESLIKSAVGFNTDRGDQVTVANIPFQDTGEGAGVETERWWEAPFFLALLKNGLIAASFLALIFLVVRPLMRNIRSSLPVSFEPVSQAEDEVQKLIDAKRAMLQSQSVSQVELIEKVKGESYQAAQVLKNWLESKG